MTSQIEKKIMTSFKPKARRKARRYAMQAMYQWQMTGGNVADIELQFLTDYETKQLDIKYFQQLLHGIPASIAKLDEQLLEFIDRPINELTPIEHAILRVGCYELQNCQDVPYKVIINEALELAKEFGTVEGFKYVNGILDKIARKIRAAEIIARS